MVCMTNMTGPTSRLVEVTLPNNTVALVQAADVDGAGQAAAEKAAWANAFDLKQVSGTLEGVAQAIRSGLEKAAPSKTTVELGLELVVKSGQLTSLLVNGQGDATLKVTLEWSREPSADDKPKA
jgi:hypothetical protein